jgi:hypothetical protein
MSRKQEITDMNDVVRLLSESINDLLELPNTITRARTIASLSNSMIKALEFAELEERVEKLEELLSRK